MEPRARLRDLFRQTEGKVFRRALILLAVGLILALIGHALERSEGEGWFLAGSVAADLGIATMIASITIFLVDIGMRKEMLNDIEDIVKAGQSTKYIKSFQPQRKDYGENISADIKIASAGDYIDIIGISLGIVSSENPGIAVIQQKILEGCRFRMLLLHPESQLVDCIENLSREYGYDDLRFSITHNARGKLRQLINKVTKQRGNKNRHFGSIEFRLFRDVNSTLSYYGSPRIVILGLYYAHTDGGLSPGFQAIDPALIEYAKSHFAALWDISRGNVLARISSKELVDNLETYFPKPSS